ncbi:hypothetical protein FRC12_013752 [Ceratobasidium sp. 428]|nr:hypothetical protein FRC12_013752 [Ceratobasidium sp. 428]
MFLVQATTFLALVLQAAAHTNLHGVYVGTGAPPSNDYNCVRPATNNNPITNYGSSDMICNTVTGVAANTCTANPGDTVTMVWHEHNMQETIAVGGAHHGPIQAYIAKVPSASQTTVTGLSWTKIYSGGLYTDGLWATDIANNNKGLIRVTLPCDLPPGDYLLRSELIALHSAGGANGAQLYVGCAQLRVGGSGTGMKSTPTSLPGYSAQDPGLLINIYGTLTSYKAPGPTVYLPTCAETNWHTKQLPQATAGTTSLPASATATEGVYK